MGIPSGAYKYSALVQQLNFDIFDPGYPSDFHKPGERVAIRGNYRLVDKYGNNSGYYYEDLLMGSTFPPTRAKELYFVLDEEKVVKTNTSLTEM